MAWNEGLSSQYQCKHSICLLASLGCRQLTGLPDTDLITVTVKGMRYNSRYQRLQRFRSKQFLMASDEYYSPEVARDASRIRDVSLICCDS